MFCVLAVDKIKGDQICGHHTFHCFKPWLPVCKTDLFTPGQGLANHGSCQPPASVMAHRLRTVFVFVNGYILSGYGSAYKTAFILPLCQQSLEY